MSKYFLAIDIGASSGRHILGSLENGRLRLEEIHRFSNGIVKKGNELCWDLEALFDEIKKGMKRCKEIGKFPYSVGIDTWGVDFVLLDGNEKVLGNTVSYRDNRTYGMDERVYEIIGERELYQRTGIQKQLFNTIYQLMAIKEKQPDYLEKAESMLLIPDYFHFLLSGVKKTEYTNATTTQLVSPMTMDWDHGLIERLGYPQRLFKKLEKPGTVLGTLKREIREELGYDCRVVLPATHDTGSAVVAVPTINSNSVYISSGTWSLMGIEAATADCSKKSHKSNFTNEGGYDYRFRYLKNIMGLWMIQSVKKEINNKYSFAELCDMASLERIASIVDCNDKSFLAPDSMIQAVQACCRKSGQQVPQSVAEIAAVIYNSLASCYRDTIEELEKITGRSFDSINVVGGGANAEYLNKLTARHTKRKVLTGPIEATAIGNIVVQMMGSGELTDLVHARECVQNSFEIKTY